MRSIRSVTLIASAWMITLALFLALTTSCQSIPSEGMNLAYPERPANPDLSFKDVGDNCINDKALRRLGTFYIDSKAYFDKTEAIIDAVNGK